MQLNIRQPSVSRDPHCTDLKPKSAKRGSTLRPGPGRTVELSWQSNVANLTQAVSWPHACKSTTVVGVRSLFPMISRKQSVPIMMYLVYPNAKKYPLVSPHDSRDQTGRQASKFHLLFGESKFWNVGQLRVWPCFMTRDRSDEARRATLFLILFWLSSRTYS